MTSALQQPRLLTRLSEALRFRRYSFKTENAYVHWARRYIYFLGKRHPKDMGAKEVTAFLNHLANAGQVAAATQNQALSALRFLYRDILEIDLPWLDGLVRAKSAKRLPTDEHIERVKAIHAVDLAQGLGEAPLPLALAGHNIRVVQQLMGHKHVETTMIYTHVMNGSLAEVCSPADTSVT